MAPLWMSLSRLSVLTISTRLEVNYFLFHICSTGSQSSQALLYRLPCAGNTSWLALFVTYIIIWEDGGGKKTFWGYRLQELNRYLFIFFFFCYGKKKETSIVFSSSVITAVVAGFIWCLFAVINHVM